jgi:GTP cyclohydrolase II
MSIDMAVNVQGGVEWISSCQLPTPWATFDMHIFVDAASGQEHVALALGPVDDGRPVLSRVHSECLTGDALSSQRCDCGAQLQAAQERIAAEGRGVLLYLRQEGRGIGLVNKVRAYHLQDHGADTVEANLALGFPADMRDYAMCPAMLEHLGVSSLRLMSNNPAKRHALESVGVRIVDSLPIRVGFQAHNLHYLETKQRRMGHELGMAL